MTLAEPVEAAVTQQAHEAELAPDFLTERTKREVVYVVQGLVGERDTA